MVKLTEQKRNLKEVKPEKCPRCGKEVIWLHGYVPSVKLRRLRRRYICHGCGHTFYKPVGD